MLQPFMKLLIQAMITNQCFNHQMKDWWGIRRCMVPKWHQKDYFLLVRTEKNIKFTVKECCHSHPIINLSINNGTNTYYVSPNEIQREVYILAKMFNWNVITFYTKYREQKNKLRTPQRNTPTNPGGGVFYGTTSMVFTASQSRKTRDASILKEIKRHTQLQCMIPDWILEKLKTMLILGDVKRIIYFVRCDDVNWKCSWVNKCAISIQWNTIQL